ncbi:MAG TPA: MurR/RpiR family transcriptional regulator [Limnochordia bacterium]|nr:MurR/RpiR family transcriptional regulator [Limnochordia bacterium]
MSSNEAHLQPDGCLLRIRGLFPALRPSEKKVAEYVLAHPDEVVNLSVTELAQKSGVSDATIVKFSQRIGYSGYQQFKIMLSRELARPPQANYGELDPDDDMPKVKAKVISMNMRALEQTLHTLSDTELERAVEALCAAPVIHIYGVGASGFVALDAEHKFLRINRRCHAFIDNHVQRAMATLLGPGDVAIGISNSGFTQDIVSALRIAREAGATTICITNHFDSPITQVSDIRLFTAAQEPAFRSGAIASRVAQLSIIDVLFIGVAQRDYDRTVEYLEKTRIAAQSDDPNRPVRLGRRSS